MIVCVGRHSGRKLIFSCWGHHHHSGSISAVCRQHRIIVRSTYRQRNRSEPVAFHQRIISILSSVSVAYQQRSRRASAAQSQRITKISSAYQQRINRVCTVTTRPNTLASAATHERRASGRECRGSDAHGRELPRLWPQASVCREFRVLPASAVPPTTSAVPTGRERRSVGHEHRA